MPSLDDVRTLQARFRDQCSKLVLKGTGDPNPAVGVIGTAYYDTSTTPATVWVKRRSGWEKASLGATE